MDGPFGILATRESSAAVCRKTLTARSVRPIQVQTRVVNGPEDAASTVHGAKELLELDCRVLILAQLSLAPARSFLEGYPVPILTSPAYLAQAVANLFQSEVSNGR